MPERKSAGAIGYDVAARAILCPFEMDKYHPYLRKTLSNVPDDSQIARHAYRRGTELLYRMDLGESVLVGLGFITAMPFPLFYWVAPRSGLASKFGITVTNAPGTVDPDYRGEAGVLVYNRNQSIFDLARGMRITQIIFQWAVIPVLDEVAAYDDLVETGRGAGGFGSTGIQ